MKTRTAKKVDQTATGQVWKDRQGRLREIVGIDAWCRRSRGSTIRRLNSMSEIDPKDLSLVLVAYDVIWKRPGASKKEYMAWTGTWEKWIRHAELVVDPTKKEKI